MRKITFFIVFALLLLVGNTHAQVSKKKVFMRMMEQLSKTDDLKDYFDRTSLSKEIKMKLIVSDFKEKPILKDIHEGDNYIIAPYDKVLKSDADFYLMPSEISFRKDTSFVVFELINKYNVKLKGKFTLVPNKATYDYEDENATQILALYK